MEQRNHSSEQRMFISIRQSVPEGLWHIDATYNGRTVRWLHKEFLTRERAKAYVKRWHDEHVREMFKVVIR